MSFEVKPETLDQLAGYYRAADHALNWPFVFSLPTWLQSWWEAFGAGFKPCLRSVSENGQLIGIAPLICDESTGRLLGSPDVCDYLDFITVAGKEKEFFSALLPALRREGLGRLVLSAQRPDSAAFGALLATGTDPGSDLKINYRRENESFELPLPPAWKDYLTALSKKQRHEVRRKLRRLERETAGYRYRVLEEKEAVQDFTPAFFELLQYHPDKAEFFTQQMEQFFRSLIGTLAPSGLVRFGLLEIEGAVAAAVLYFDYNGRYYLYNSGFKPDYKALSAGLLSKVLCLKHGIEQGRTVFDFLKGQEVYKSRLGGRSVPVYEIEVEMS